LQWVAGLKNIEPAKIHGMMAADRHGCESCRYLTLQEAPFYPRRYRNFPASIPAP
jgi:hypothetical protein